MQFECHITVGATDINQFKKDCIEIGVKPIVIEVPVSMNTERQVMTSSKHTGQDFIKQLNHISSFFINKGYKIEREKIEIKPSLQRHPGFIYYESHFRLQLPKIFDTEWLKEMCIQRNFHLSKNVLKNSQKVISQMCTYRSKTDSFEDFRFKVDSFSKLLKDNLIHYDKVEVEECIYDSNESIDKNWISKN